LLCQTAVSSALSAGQLLRDYWTRPRHIASKGLRDVVTDADFASQALLTGMVRAQFPSHGFMVEEDDPSLPTSGDYIWIIDPVDGTSNYSRQMGNYTISIGVARPHPATGELEVVAGAIYDPQRDELFSGFVGGGAWLGTAAHPQQHPLAVSQVGEVHEAIIALDWSHQPERRTQTVAILNTAAPLVRTVRAVGSAALALAWVASGRLEMYYNLGIKPWDAAAGQLLVREAGGVVGSWSGEGWMAKQSDIIASNGRLHKDFLAFAPTLLPPVR
jgi:myo-inositol-1(or 4)-monophosphatase